MIYRDALNALYAFGGIYAAGVLGWSIIEIGIFGIVAAITGAVGAWFGGGAWTQRFGPKPVVILVCIALFCRCLLAHHLDDADRVLFVSVGPRHASILPDVVFYVAGALIGAAGGSIQAASRTLLVDQVPRARCRQGLWPLCAVGTGDGLHRAAGDRLDDGDLRAASAIGVTPIIALFCHRRPAAALRDSARLSGPVATCRRTGPDRPHLRLPSVPEMAHAGEHHGDAGLVGGRDHLVVAHRAARLDHRRRAGLDRGQQPVGEGKERVGGDDRAPGQRFVQTGALAASSAFRRRCAMESTRLI